ncbi:DUF4185 domain-containing protein [Fulvivirgaceae bacterium BMA12]|uniref:DUF4185 domain-containing protein n=1 Tax=Agaribacillus aureus TaxID=3051825 RepID=A0ABT8LJH2_9BACT|nr:DUF4185 domain-containing protein [Fulvivirgaceae bacterium BMA12]
MMKNCLLAGIIYSSLLFSCTQEKGHTEDPPFAEPKKDLKFTVEKAPEWTAMFKRSSGWFGGDGIFAIPFSGVDVAKGTSEADSVLFVFSDTMLGEIRDGKLQPGYKMVNNSVAVLKGGDPDDTRMKFLIADETGSPNAIFTPQTPASKPGEYYWLGDGFVNQERENSLYIFAYRIQNLDNNSLFPFKEVGNSLLVIPRESQFPFEEHYQLDIPFFTSSKGDSTHISFGAGVLENTVDAGVPGGDGYVYVYGVKGDKKKLVAARVQPRAVENFETWQFWDGVNWSSNPDQMVPVSDSVSNELSVVPLANGQYALIYQYIGIFPDIYMQIGPSPVGPFGPRQKIYDTRDDITDPDLFTYNAKGHPAISKPGELLISYNVNSFKFFDIIEAKPFLYRPRFFKIVFDEG